MSYGPPPGALEAALGANAPPPPGTSYADAIRRKQAQTAPPQPPVGASSGGGMGTGQIPAAAYAQAYANSPNAPPPAGVPAPPTPPAPPPAPPPLSPYAVAIPAAQARDQAVETVQGDNSVDSLLSEMRGISDAAAVTRDPEAKARLLADAQAIRDQVDALLASPLQATAVAEQMAAENRAQALSARGGAGAQQQAMLQAQNRQPALQAQAAQAAAQEQQQRATAAAGMLSQAAGVEAQSTAFDIDIGKSNQDSANAFVQQMGQLGFGELQLDQNDRHEVGQMIRDFATLMQNGTIDLAKLSLEQQDMLLDDALGRYDISERTRVQLKAISKQGKKDFWDKLQVVGGLIPGA